MVRRFPSILWEDSRGEHRHACRPRDHATPRPTARPGRRPRQPSAPCCAGPATIRTARACVDTPARVARAYEEFFAGYAVDPIALLERTFEETDGYDEIVLLRDIRLESHCEHHMVPIIGRAHVAYLPHRRVVGISKLARVVEAYAKRLQIQEKLTAQIANTIQEVLEPRGVAVVIEAAHQCMTTRGVHKPGVTMVTSRMLGAFRDDPDHAARIAGDDRQRQWNGRRALKPSSPRRRGPRPAASVSRAWDSRLRGNDSGGVSLGWVEHQRPDLDTLARQRIGRRGRVLECRVRREAGPAIGL